jgi:hypothetical protein
MWMYPGPSFPDRSFSTKLDNADIDIRVQRILALRAHWNSGPNLIPLREGVIIPWVSPPSWLPLDLCKFLPFLMSDVYMCKVMGVCTATHGRSLYPRMWRGRRPTMPSMKGSMRESRGCGLGALPGWLRGRGGRKPHPSTDLYELTISSMGPTSHVNLLLDVKIIRS